MKVRAVLARLRSDRWFLVATGASIDEIKARMTEAITMHLEGMREDGVAPSAPTVVCDYVAVPA